MKQVSACAFCDGNAHLNSETKEYLYRKEHFIVHQYFYKCELCHEEFTTTEVDTFSLVQVHNQYRAKHNIPFVEELIKTKEQYGLSASKMNEVLGLGANSYSNFEHGDMPSPAMANLLKLAGNPSIFREMALKSTDVFSEQSMAELMNRIALVESSERKKVKVDAKWEPSSLNGYRTASVSKIANVVSYFIATCKRAYNDKLKLNKLLFYADFNHYKTYGISITGLSYRAIPHGPVPSNYDLLFAHLTNENYIENDWEMSDKRGGIEIFTSVKGYDLSELTEEEQNTLRYIAEQLKDMPSWDLRNKSHEEEGWKDCYPNKEIIDYQKYAFGLRL